MMEYGWRMLDFQSDISYLWDRNLSWYIQPLIQKHCIYMCYSHLEHSPLRQDCHTLEFNFTIKIFGQDHVQTR